MAKYSSSAEVVAHNVRRLMEHHSLSQAELGRRAGVAQTMISGLVSRQDGSKNPRSDTIDKLAAFFKVAPWMLLIPDIDMDMLTDQGLKELVESYARVPALGRATILRIAEAEVRYAQTEQPATKTGTL
ncbi:TPA: helix-turn-helix transcriptional regulator [Stenotrophomonas maltophilia]|uniref:helix-turn-helix domain-containing protein n=1 Tax=Stenotrophomonas TaxID=40323 RepID=UPI001441C5BC|nr:MULTISPECIES: helix-turn-helix transcriptional regulator [Stenotrophomonas]HDX0792343.1 helix-turn-helix transcriptional regulator [Stenotrophomonas maltophilia]HDX0938781.1 helix-turn-helix transcriptional regulator [Stenotrophomonas maltophilia]